MNIINFARKHRYILDRYLSLYTIIPEDATQENMYEKYPNECAAFEAAFKEFMYNLNEEELSVFHDFALNFPFVCDDLHRRTHIVARDKGFTIGHTPVGGIENLIDRIFGNTKPDIKLT